MNKNKNMDLFIRITLPYEFFAKSITNIAENCDTLIVYEHSRETESAKEATHCHAYMTGWKASTDTLKNWIKKHSLTTGWYEDARLRNTERKGNGFWSFATEWKGEPLTAGCITYMAKGKLVPKYNKGYTEEEITVLQSKWVNQPHKANLKQYIIKETAKESKMRQADMIKEIRKQYNKLKLDNTFTEPDERSENLSEQNKRLLYELIRKVVVVQNNTILGRYKYRDYYDTVLALEEPNYWKRQMEQFVTFPQPRNYF